MENDWAYRIIELLIYDLDFGIGFYGHKVTVYKCPYFTGNALSLKAPESSRA
jgi:hypothetical protein